MSAVNPLYSYLMLAIGLAPLSLGCAPADSDADGVLCRWIVRMTTLKFIPMPWVLVVWITTVMVWLIRCRRQRVLRRYRWRWFWRSRGTDTGLYGTQGAVLEAKIVRQPILHLIPMPRNRSRMVWTTTAMGRWMKWFVLRHQSLSSMRRYWVRQCPTRFTPKPDDGQCVPVSTVRPHRLIRAYQKVNPGFVPR